jgi:putative transposase
MKNPVSLQKRHRFPAEITQYAVWFYYRFNLSYRDIEDLLAEKGILVSYEAIIPRFFDELFNLQSNELLAQIN